MSRPRQTYEAPEITVTFEASVCEHSGGCLQGLPLGLDVRRKRWIRPELAAADQAASQVERCPSGALQYVRK